MNEPTLKNLYTLQNKYDEKMAQYEQAFRDLQSTLINVSGLTSTEINKINSYMNSLNTQTLVDQAISEPQVVIGDDMKNIMNKIKNSQDGLIIKPGRGFAGDSIVSNGIVYITTAQECLTNCKQHKDCTGATFYKENKACSMASGNGKIYTDSNTDAIVNKVTDLMQTLLSYNYQLMVINKEIKNEILNTPSNSQDTWNTTTDEMEVNVTNQHNALLIQREALEKVAQQYDVSSIGVNETELTTNQSFYWYRIWTIFILFIFYFSIIFLTGISIHPLVHFLIIIFVVWAIGFKYLAFIMLIIYILYYIYMIPMN